MVLHNACMIDGAKVSVLSGIEEMVGSLRNRIASGNAGDLKLQTVLPVEIMEAIKE